MLHLIIVECSNHRGRKTEGDRLQHQTFGGVAGLPVDVSASATAILDRRALEDRGNANRCRRGRDPVGSKNSTGRRAITPPLNDSSAEARPIARGI